MKVAPYYVGTQRLHAVNYQRTDQSGMRLVILNSNITGKVEGNKQSSILMVSMVFP
jgi:hypothetical protein